MPVIKSSTPPPEPFNLPTVTQVASKGYRHSIVDTRNVPHAALLTFIGGYPYITEYYGQVLGANESPAAYDMSQSATYQQYDRITRYQMMLQSELSISLDAATSEATVTGSAILYPFLKPNVGDVFIGDIGNGQAGLFHVTEVYPKTIRKLTCHEIQFKLYRYMDQSIEDDLASKIVRDYHFKKDLIVYGQNPLILSEELVRQESMEAMFKSTLNRFFEDFFSREFATLIVPQQSLPTYDPYVTTAFLKIIAIEDDPRIHEVRRLNCADFGIDDQTCIWSMLIAKNDDVRDRVFRTHGLLSTNLFPAIPRQHGVRFSGVKRVLIPTYHRDDNSRPYARYPQVTNDLGITELAGVPLISMGLDDSYVLGEYFYTRSRENMFGLEIMADKALMEESNGIAEFNAVYQAVNKMPLFHRFYCQFLLLILLKLELRRE